MPTCMNCGNQYDTKRNNNYMVMTCYKCKRVFPDKDINRMLNKYYKGGTNHANSKI